MVRVSVLAVLWSCLVSSLHAGAVLTPDQPLAPSPRAGAAYDQKQVSAASSGDQSLVVWSDRRMGLETVAQIFATRVAADGKVLDPEGIRVGAGTENAVAWHGDAWVVFAGGKANHLAYRVTRNGDVSAAVPSAPVAYPRLVSNGRDLVLGGLTQINGELSFLDSAGRVTSSVPVGDNESTVVPVADGNDWLAFHDVRDLFTGKTHIAVLRAGSAAPAVELFETDQFPYISVAGDGTGRFLVAWSTAVPLDSLFNTYLLRVHYAVVDRNGAILAPAVEQENVLVTTAPGLPIILGNNVEPEPPAVAFDGKQFVVGWTWYEGKGQSELRVVRINPDGSRVDAQPLVVERASDSQRVPKKSPQVVFTGGRALFAWSSPRPSPSLPRIDVVQRTIASFDDLAAPAEPSTVSTATRMQQAPELAPGDDGAMLAVWHEGDYGGSIMGRLMRVAGTSSAPFTISSGLREVRLPTVAFGGGVYLVAWREEEYVLATGRYKSMRIVARRYNRSGNALDPVPVLLAEEQYPQSGYFLYPTIGIASDGQQFLVTWPGLSDDRIRAARISTGGTVLDPTPFAVSPAAVVQRASPRPVWTGQHFLVMWTEDPTPVIIGSGPVPNVPRYLRSTRVSPNGTVLDDTFPVMHVTPETGIPGGVRLHGVDAAFNGSEVMVTWAKSFGGFSAPPACVFAQRFTANGTPLDASPTSIACARTSGITGDSNGDSDVFWDGSRWWIVYANLGSEGRATAVPLGGTPVEISGDSSARTAKAVMTPFGPFFAYVRLDSASHVRRIFARSMFESARRRSARH